MEKMMKSAIYYGERDIRIEERPIPKAGRYGVVVKVKACGVCPLIDMEMWQKTSEKHKNNIGGSLGHEFSGEVVEIGSQVTDIEIGDRIYAESYTPCYQCASCKEGDYYRCMNWYDGHEHSSFSEYYEFTYIIKKNLIKLPKTLSFQDLAMIEPLHLSAGLARKAKSGDVVVVLGQHLVGLGIIPLLKKLGVKKIITGEISKIRLDASGALEPDLVVDTLKDDITDIVMKETKGLGADLVLQTDTRPIANRQAMDIVRRAGKIWIGANYKPFVYDPALEQACGSNPESVTHWVGTDAGYRVDLVQWDPELFFMKSAWGTLGARVELYQEALELLESGQISAEKHVTHVFPLDKIKEAFEIAEDPHETIEVMVEP